MFFCKIWYSVSIFYREDVMKKKKFNWAGLLIAIGNEYAASIKVGRWLAFCNVYPDSKDAAHENYTENTLLKALGSSGLKLTKGAGR